jgi:hypothetical protein
MWGFVEQLRVCQLLKREFAIRRMELTEITQGGEAPVPEKSYFNQFCATCSLSAWNHLLETSFFDTRAAEHVVQVI